MIDEMFIEDNLWIFFIVIIAFMTYVGYQLNTAVEEDDDEEDNLKTNIHED
jgi:hypothetical protein